MRTHACTHARTHALHALHAYFAPCPALAWGGAGAGPLASRSSLQHILLLLLLCPLIAATQAYQRQLLLERIMDENERTRMMLEQRAAIQEQRKSANMSASMHRNKVR